MNLISSIISLGLFFSINEIGSDGYRILSVFPFNSRSHNNVFEGVTKALAKNGHQVDVVSHFEVKNPPKNYRTIINLHGTRGGVMNNYSVNFADFIQGSIIKAITQFYGNELCELMGNEEMQKLVKNPPQDPPYDLFITEAWTTSCFIGIGHLFKIPVITISSTIELPWYNEALGNPNALAFVANAYNDLSEITTFWRRLRNVIRMHQTKYEFYQYTGKAQTEAMRRYLHPNTPDVRELEKTVALSFINSFYTYNGVKSKTPAAIDIAGIHIEQDDKQLSPDLQKWMDESSQGVVYFTLGSMVLIETLPKATILAIYAAFEKIAPMRVLMKIANMEKLPPGLPSNVLTSKFFTQIPILKHNNTRVFMTHGGPVSTTESLYHNVPMIGFPLFADQFPNVHLLVKKNTAILLDYKTLIEEELTKALNSVIHDPIYRESVKRESQLFRDRPMSASQTVNFWAEYVIRNGPNVLRSPAVDLYWWQDELLDVYGFLALCFLIIVAITIKTLIFIKNQILNLSVSSNTKSNKSFIKKD